MYHKHAFINFKNMAYFPCSYTNVLPLTLQRLLLVYSDVSERTGGLCLKRLPLSSLSVSALRMEFLDLTDVFEVISTLPALLREKFPLHIHISIHTYSSGIHTFN